MDICKNKQPFKCLEDFIQKNFTMNIKKVDEIDLPVGTSELEQFLVPFIHKLSNKDTTTTFSYDADSHLCKVDYESSENKGIESINDDFVIDEAIAENKEFNNAASLSSKNLLNGNMKNNLLKMHTINGNYKNGVMERSLYSTSLLCNNNNDKLSKNSGKWKNNNKKHKLHSSLKLQMTLSAPKKASSLVKESELSGQENDKKSSKSDNFKFQNSANGHILKENNHFSLHHLQENTKPQLNYGNQHFVSSNLIDNKTHQVSSVIKDVMESMKQTVQERTCTKSDDDSESDEELMKMPVVLLQRYHNDSFENIPEMITQQKSSKKHPISCLSLDKIIEARKSEQEKDALIKNKELAFENNADEEGKDSELLQLMRPVELNASAIQRDRIADLPPGLEIFDFRRCYCYFCPLHGLSLNSCGFVGEKGTLFDKKLARMSPIEFQDIISLGAVKIHLDATLFKEALLKYLFKLLSLHNDESVAYACKDIFFYYIMSTANSKNRRFGWYPSVSEAIATIINYGINITDSCPIKDTLLNVEKTLLHSKHTCSSEMIDSHKVSLVMNGFCSILEIFTLFLEQKHLNVYSQEEICDFILLLCWLSLDVRLLGKLIRIKYERCIAAGLEMISASDWPDKMKYLAEQLAELGGHHRNILYVAMGLPVSERGIHLQRAVSFLAIQYLLKTENPCFVADVTPFMLLEFLKLNPLHRVKDYFLLHTVVSLLDLCVGNKVLPLHRNALQEMCDIAMNTFGKIRETFQCLEPTKVKDLLVRLYSKWSLLVKSLPYRKKTIFKHSSSVEHDSSKESIWVSEIKELEVDEN